MLNDDSCVRFSCMMRAARALEMTRDSRKQKLYCLNRPLQGLHVVLKTCPTAVHEGTRTLELL